MQLAKNIHYLALPCRVAMRTISSAGLDVSTQYKVRTCNTAINVSKNKPPHSQVPHFM